MTLDRAALVRWGLRLNSITIAYNVLEAIVSLGAGLVAGSAALIGFGIDSVIEVTATGAGRWRLNAELDAARRERIEGATARIIAWSFLALAAFVTYDSITALSLRERPEKSAVGVAILALSVVVMPLLARAKRTIARALRSGALAGESRQTSLCGYLSAIALAGVALNATVGWWWADPAAALAMVPIIAGEGIGGLRRFSGFSKRARRDSSS
jgi:divalent metal cation (Fe/Co/Zn/Cd) transporter